VANARHEFFHPIQAMVCFTVSAASTRPIAIVILAAGQGTRMKSTLHKVLHPVAG